MKTCDIHYHTGDGLSAEQTVTYFLRLKEATDLDKICLLSIPVSVGTQAYRLENLWVLMIKDMLYPFNLPNDVKEKIRFGNFKKLLGETLKQVNMRQ